MSFIRDYLTYATGNEAPEMFHVWSGYAALSAAISRRVWLVDGDQAIFPNLYIMLVGDAGCGKSTALRRAKRMLAELGDVPLSRSVETPEGLWRFMAGDPQANPPVGSPVRFIAKWPDGQLREVHPMTIIANEFVNFISKDREGWTSALNDIYDEDKYEYRTKNKGEDLLIGPYIVLLGALTTDISNELQKVKIISSGFARRTIFQYGERKFHEPHAFQEFTDEQATARGRCIERLRNLTKLHGSFVMDAKTRVWWKSWYDEHTVNIPEISTPQTRSWFSSKPNQVMKLGMLTSLSEDDGLTLTTAHLSVGVAYLGEMEKELFQIFGGVGRNELAAVSVQIGAYVKSQTHPVTYGELSNNFWSQSNPREFDECLNYLVSSGQVSKVTRMSGDQVEILIGTKEVLANFGAAAHAKVDPPVAVALDVSRLVVGSEVDPSIPRELAQIGDQTAIPTAVPPVPETAIVPPPMVD